MHRGRPPSAKTLVDRQLGRNVPHPTLPAGDSYILPNHSGDHSAGTTGTPVVDLDIANKKYVDDNTGIASGGEVARIVSVMPPDNTSTNIATGLVYEGGSTPVMVFRGFAFDDTTVEYMDFMCVMYDGYDGSTGVTVRLDCLAVSDDAGTIVMGATVAKIVPGTTDLDDNLLTGSTKRTGTATVDAQGRLERVAVNLSNSDMNSIAGGNIFVLRVQLDTSGTIANDVLLFPTVSVVLQ